MDNDYLTQLLKNLNITEQSIKETSRYCSINYTSSDEISAMIEDYLLNSRKDRKILYIFLIHEIFMETKQMHRKQFVISIGQKLKSIITNLAESIEKLDEMKKIKAIVEKWQKEELFHKTFIDRLQSILMPKYKQLYTESLKYDKKKDQKYDKAFLHNYKLIQENEFTKMIYNHLVEFGAIKKKIINIESEATNVISQKDQQTYKELFEHAKNIDKTQRIYKDASQKCENELLEYCQVNLDIQSDKSIQLDIKKKNEMEQENDQQ